MNRRPAEITELTEKSFLYALCGEFFTGMGAKWIRLAPRT